MMGKLTELYCCDFVPKLIPEFVDPHITVDGKQYLIEIDPNHAYVIHSTILNESRVSLLSRFGIINPVLTFKEVRPF
jgi:hypothetical protein